MPRVDPLRRLEAIPELGGLTHVMIETEEKMEPHLFSFRLTSFIPLENRTQAIVINHIRCCKLLCQGSITVDQMTRFNGNFQQQGIDQVNRLLTQVTKISTLELYGLNNS